MNLRIQLDLNEIEKGLSGEKKCAVWEFPNFSLNTHAIPRTEIVVAVKGLKVVVVVLFIVYTESAYTNNVVCTT